MLVLQIGMLSVAALVSILFGVRYFRAKEFMPYHATVAGKEWSQLGAGVQAIVLGMLKICAAGFLTYGLTILWLLIPLYHGSEWAAWAALSISATGLGPVLYVTVSLRRVAPAARTPIIPATSVLVLALCGAGLSLFN